MARDRALSANRENIPKYLTQRLAENVQQAPSLFRRVRQLALTVNLDHSLRGDLASVILVIEIPTQTIPKRQSAQYAQKENMPTVQG